jgi:hypothetical protein
MTTFIIVEWACIIIMLAFLLTQVAVPAIMGIPLFPFLRKPHREADQRLAEAQDSVVLQDVEEKAMDLEKEVWMAPKAKRRKK